MALVEIREVSCSACRPILANHNHAMTGVITPEKHILNQKENVKYKAYTIMNEQKTDNVNHPAHYTWLKDLCGIEVIDITRHMDFNLGQVLKYILRLGHKEDNNFTYYEKILSDLHKAEYYLKKEIIKIDKLCKKNGNH